MDVAELVGGGIRLPYTEIWILDTEFIHPDGEPNQIPVCLVAVELFTGKVIYLWLYHESPACPWNTQRSDILFVAFAAAAEWDTFTALNWPAPVAIIDLFYEFKWLRNNLPKPDGTGLLAACRFFGFQAMDKDFKQDMRALVMDGGPYAVEDIPRIFEYCKLDVDSTLELFRRMAVYIDLPRALVRGAYSVVQAAMQRQGIPLDSEFAQTLVNCTGAVRSQLIERLDPISLFINDSFNHATFTGHVKQLGITSWPTTSTGKLKTDSRTLEKFSAHYPSIAAVHNLNVLLDQLKLLPKLPIGSDGRNRCYLRPMTSITGRNQPSNKEFLFGIAKVWRKLIQAPPGKVLAYIDFKSQEYGIAAIFSGDEKMQQGYASGDPYMQAAIDTGFAPAGATKATHSKERSMFKVMTLAVNYGATEYGIAQQLRVSLPEARNMLRRHKETFRKFWRWSDAIVAQAQLELELTTPFGWKGNFGPNSYDRSPRSLRNFLMQSTGGDILRLASIGCHQAGIKINASIHDALMIEMDADLVADVIDTCQSIMTEAANVVMGESQIPINTDVECVIQPGERFPLEPRDAGYWDAITSAIA